MKKLIYILLAMYPLFFSSCEDYFEPEQTGLVEGDVFYKDLNNLRIGLNSIYNLMQSQQYQLSEIIFGEAMSDNSWNKQDVEVNEMGNWLISSLIRKIRISCNVIKSIIRASIKLIR